jgi:hypothetical protein
LECKDRAIREKRLSGIAKHADFLSSLIDLVCGDSATRDNWCQAFHQLIESMKENFPVFFLSLEFTIISIGVQSFISGIYS